jgi:hypothetical protein
MRPRRKASSRHVAASQGALALTRTLTGAENVVDAGSVDKHLSAADVEAAKSEKSNDSGTERILTGHHEKWTVETRESAVSTTR